MSTPRQEAGAHGSGAAVDASLSQAERLAELLEAKPTTPRERTAQAYVRLALAMCNAGLEPRPAPRKQTYAQRLRLGLETGRFAPPNAPALLGDLNRAAAGDREAQQRVVDYLNLPGVLGALGDD